MDLESRARIHAALSDPQRLAVVESLVSSDRSPSELAAALEMSSNLLAHHLNVLADAGVVERRVSEGDHRRRYVVLRRDVMHELSFGLSRPHGRVVFVCTHNSARSQYAAALYARVTGQEAVSAGVTPAATVHPMAIEVAGERGVDLSGAEPKGYASLSGDIDVVVSVCDRAGEEPLPPAAEHRHWSIPDPVAKGTAGAFRLAFDELDRRMAGWIG